MSYTPQPAPIVLAPDQPTRKVLLALEVFDPLAQTLVSGGLQVAAQGLGKPIVSWSGRFVWLDEGAPWPGQISITPGRLPFESRTIQPTPPANPANPTLSERLVRIILTPTAAADFSGGVTAIRGQLRESVMAPSPAVTDAQAGLAWFEGSKNVWVPSGQQGANTSQAGQFAAFLRLNPSPKQHPDLTKNLLKVRLEFTRNGIRRATPDDYKFLDGSDDPTGRVVEGQLLPRDLKLGWAELKVI